jgi:hypothetical protein
MLMLTLTIRTSASSSLAVCFNSGINVCVSTKGLIWLRQAVSEADRFAKQLKTHLVIMESTTPVIQNDQTESSVTKEGCVPSAFFSVNLCFTNIQSTNHSIEADYRVPGSIIYYKTSNKSGLVST